MATPPIVVDSVEALPEASAKLQQAYNNRLKITWDQCMGSTSKTVRHDKTSVFLLSWEPSHDDLGVGGEVQRLRKVFEDVYGFKVYEQQLAEALPSGQKKPRHKASRDLASFVYEEDCDRGLLIIYYAGHGVGGIKSGELSLVGRLGFPPTPGAQEAMDAQKEQLERNGIVWSEVEPAIKTTNADVLLIFDCCEAGKLGQPFRGTPSSFEFLGACSPNEKTRGPGDQSFTSAMIASLETLAKNEEAFTTQDLLDHIMMHKHFPGSKQTPILTDRRRGGDHIVISRKGLLPGTARQALSAVEREKEFSEREYFTVRFHYDHKVNMDHVKTTAYLLKDQKDVKGAEWSRVTFHGKASVVEVAANKWMEHTRSRRSFSGVSNAGSPALYVDTQAALSSGNGHSPQLSAHPSTLVGSERPSRTSSAHVRNLSNERTPLLDYSARSQSRKRQEESILYHLHAIYERLIAMPSSLLAWLSQRLNPGHQMDALDQEAGIGG